MKTFSHYFLMKELHGIEEAVILESSATETMKEKYVAHFYEKFPKIQYDDVEDAFEEAKASAKDQKNIKKEMERILSDLNKKKKGIKKNLSCVKVIKSAMGDESPVSSLIKRAHRILTSQERKVLSMCSQGKSVRVIGKELEMSPVTAWRVLNSAIDKIRVSHGMRSRHMDRR